MFAVGWMVSASVATRRRRQEEHRLWVSLAIVTTGLATLYAVVTTERLILGEVALVAIVAAVVTRQRPLTVRQVALGVGAVAAFPILFGLRAGAGGLADTLVGLRRRPLRARRRDGPVLRRVPGGHAVPARRHDPEAVMGHRAVVRPVDIHVPALLPDAQWSRRPARTCRSSVWAGRTEDLSRLSHGASPSGSPWSSSSASSAVSPCARALRCVEWRSCRLRCSRRPTYRVPCSASLLDCSELRSRPTPRAGSIDAAAVRPGASCRADQRATIVPWRGQQTSASRR